MRCAWTRRRIGAYIDEELDLRQRRAVAAHIDGCPSCRTHLSSLLSVEEALDMLSAPQVPEGFTERVMSNARLHTRPHRWRWGLGLVPAAAGLRLARLGAAAAVTLALVLGWTLGREMATPAETRPEAGLTFLEGTEWFSAVPPGSIPAGYLALVETAEQPGRKP